MEILSFIGFLILGFLALALFVWILAILAVVLIVAYLALPIGIGIIIGTTLWENGADNLGVIVIILSFIGEFAWLSWGKKTLSYTL
jgi:hypothetical protein